MLKTIDTKNKLIINKLIKKYWSLNEKSQKLFTHRLLYERDIPKEFSFVGEDLRYRVPLDSKIMKEFDPSWKDFSASFETYIKDRNVSYDNYLDNKITVNKNTVKIVKDIISYYKEIFYKMSEGFSLPFEQAYREREIFDFRFLEDKIKREVHSYVKDKIYDTKDFFDAGFMNLKLKSKHRNETGSITKKLFDDNYFFDDEEIIISYYNKSYNSVITMNMFFDKENIVSIKKKIRKTIDEYIGEFYRDKYQRIVERRVFNSNDYELVISLNFADWFLASTGDSWSSCISLYSIYDECYWTGLVNLIGDKSRAMVYITRKGEKKNYRGIVVDKFKIRTWVQLYRTIKPTNVDDNSKKYNKTFFNVVRTYPAEMEKSVFVDVLKNIIGIDSYKDIANMFGGSYYRAQSRYYAENFWFKENRSGLETLNTIYLDFGAYKIAKKNKAKYFYGDYGYYKFIGEGSAYIYGRSPYRKDSISKDVETLSNGISFDEIIEERSSIIEQMDGWIYNREMRNYDEEYEDDWEEEGYG